MAGSTRTAICLHKLLEKAATEVQREIDDRAAARNCLLQKLQSALSDRNIPVRVDWEGGIFCTFRKAFCFCRRTRALARNSGKSSRTWQMRWPRRFLASRQFQTDAIAIRVTCPSSKPFYIARSLRRSRLFGQLPGRNKLKAGSRLMD